MLASVVKVPTRSGRKGAPRGQSREARRQIKMWIRGLSPADGNKIRSILRRDEQANPSAAHTLVLESYPRINGHARTLLLDKIREAKRRI